MRKEIYCLQVGQGSLDEFMREHLFLASQSMLRTGMKKHVFGGDYTGFIKMEDNVVSVGFMTGQVFSAEVRGVNNTEFVGTYIVRPSDMESLPGRWGTYQELACPKCGIVH